MKDSLETLFQFVKRNNFTIIDIKTEHLLQINLLPFFHKDPFDRIIIAQGIVENLQIASKDSIFTEYPVSVVW